MFGRHAPRSFRVSNFVAVRHLVVLDASELVPGAVPSEADNDANAVYNDLKINFKQHWTRSDSQLG